MLQGGEEAALEEVAKSRKRQLAWAEKHPDSDPSERGAKKRARSAAYGFARYLDNQAALSRGSGLTRVELAPSRRHRA